MEDKQGKRKPGRPRTRTMEEFWEKQREWTKSYYDRNRQKVCPKQKTRHHRNKPAACAKAHTPTPESKIANLEAELAELEKGADNIEEE